ncbi:hypothetical protein [Nitrospira lenta]|uniref:Lipoprotein n=1 Tax=Nitrospira lenta TaxID=1436998 RepID=A0A330LBB1_9BACT|nr:hypothetical protein [Nitrospira lenta]SPP66588.1 exported hypothetical protein [Nitrospira lenta]
MTKSILTAALTGSLLCAAIAGCVADTSTRDVAGPYATWNDVIQRWIGGTQSALYLELGPPNLIPQTLADGNTEMVWDFSIDRMPGQADEYHLLPLYGGDVNCQLRFLADPNGIIQAGTRVGCD